MFLHKKTLNVFPNEGFRQNSQKYDDIFITRPFYRYSKRTKRVHTIVSSTADNLYYYNKFKLWLVNVVKIWY